MPFYVHKIGTFQGLLLCGSLLLFLAVLLGCNEEAKKVATRPSTTELHTTGEQKHLSKQGGRLLSTDYLENDYLIGPGDVLDVKVFGAEEFDRKLRVSATGNIRFPYVGRIRVEGMTLADLEFTLAELLGEKYLKDPQVSVFIEEFNSKSVTVVGEVGKPQVLKLRKNSSTLMEVLGEVGGITEDAGKTIYVIRSTPAQAVADANPSWSNPIQASFASTSPYTHNFTPDDEAIMVQMQDVVIPINVSELLEYRNPMANIEILPGDIVTVPRGQFFFIIGQVENPGAYQLREGMTALQALSMGGKFSPTYKPGNIKLIRRESDGSVTITTLNLKKIAKGLEDDLEVLPGDVFIVGRSVAKTVALQTLDIAKAALNAFSAAFAWEAVRND